MKILVLADSRSFHTGRYVRELHRQGCRVMLASLERGGEVQITLKRRGVIRACDYPAAALQIRSLVKRFRPDVINPHYASGYGFAVALAKVRKLAPVVLQLWGSDVLIVPGKSIVHALKTEYGLRHADCVLGDSEVILEQASRLAELKAKRRIYWGIEEKFLGLRRPREERSGPLEVIVPRPHEEVYNNPFLLEALAPMINEGRIEITFPEFGGGIEAFRQKAQELCQGKVRFYPKMPRPDYLAFLAGQDVYLSGARSDSSPVSLIEAAGLGVIPIAAAIPGVGEWLTPESGFVFDGSNADSLRMTMAEVIDRFDNLQEMREGNIARVRDEAVFEKNMAETIEVMRELMRKGKA